MASGSPAVLVWSSLFPSPAQPQAGIFIRERMFRVGRQLPLTVISPQPWFPLQGLVRRFRPHFRPWMPRYERQSGIDVYRPRYFSIPGIFKWLDGDLMALGAFLTVRKLARTRRVSVIDAHFAYPDGYAAGKVGRWLAKPVTVTLRGTEARHAGDARLRRKLLTALHAADRIFAVSDSLRRLVVGLGIPGDRVRVIGNGVDSEKFKAIDRAEARRSLGLDSADPVLITVGGLVERKGFHRVIACLPSLATDFPGLRYLVVGSGGPEGDYSARLRAQVANLGLTESVRFLGALSPEGVCRALSAASVFVLATRHEGWANVLLEAMSCGVPVVATDVGGNAEVVCRPELGRVIPFDDHEALLDALRLALRQPWDRDSIRAYARKNDWQVRVDALVDEFQALSASRGLTHARAQ